VSQAITPDNPITAPPAGEAALPARGAGVAVMTPSGLAATVVLSLAFVGLFHHWFYIQNFISWNNSGDWGHAYFVPIVSLYLLWLKRDELARVEFRTFWPALIPFVLGIMCYLIFQVSTLNNHMVRGWSLILTLFGLVMLVGGPGLIRVAFWPIAYLIFMITVSDPIMRAITFKLQLIASDGAWVLLNMIGVPTEVDGNVLKVQTDTGVIPLNVAEACAGMRMVIAFLALGVAVALAGAPHWWQRVVLLYVAVPVAVLMNIFRVAALGVLALYNPELAKGESHMLVGTLLLIPAFLLYMGVVWALNKAVTDDKPKAPAGPPAVLWRPGPMNLSYLAIPVVAVPLAIMTLSAVAIPTAVSFMGIHLRKLPIQAPAARVVSAIPVETASWIRVGQDHQESAEMVEELGTQNYLTRAYIRKGSVGDKPESVSLHLAYYTGMIDTIPHIPERCMVGGGFQIVGGPFVIPIKFDRQGWLEDRGVEGEHAGKIMTARTSSSFSDAPGVRVRLPRNVDESALRITEFASKSGDRLFAGYMFIANGGVTDAAESVRLLAFDLKDDYAYYLKVQVSANGITSAEELAARASSLLSELLPELMRSVPDWVEVQAGRYPDDHPRRAALGAARAASAAPAGGR